MVVGVQVPLRVQNQFEEEHTARGNPDCSWKSTCMLNLNLNLSLILLYAQNSNSHSNFEIMLREQAFSSLFPQNSLTHSHSLTEGCNFSKQKI